MVNTGTDQERGERAEAALRQIMTCARAECGDCQLVPNPENWKECVQVFDTCEEILREELGITVEVKGEDNGTEAE